MRSQVALLLMFATPIVASDRWPQFRGPDAAGVSEQALPSEFGPDKNVRWSVSTPAGHSSPSIWGERLFLSGWEKDSKKLVLLSFDTRTGKLLWKREVPATEIEKTHEVGIPAMSTPAADGDRVYAYFGSAGLFAFDFDGKPVWSYPLPLPKMRYGAGTSPIIAGDLILLNRDEQEGAFLVALDRKTGKEFWKIVNPTGQGGGGGESYATPVVWKGHVVLHRSGEVVGHSLQDGKRVWWVKLNSSGTSTPAVSESAMFVAGWSLAGDPEQLPPLPSFAELLAKNDKDGDGAVSYTEFPSDLPVAARPGLDPVSSGAVMLKRFIDKIDPSKDDGKITAEDWEKIGTMAKSFMQEHGIIAIAPGGNGDVTATHVRWKEKKSVPEVPSPVVVKDRVYMIRNGGVLTAMKSDSGEVVYRGRIGAPGPYYASLIAANGSVVAASGEGKVTVVRPGDSLEVLTQADFGEPIFATPAPAGGSLFVRTSGHLYAIGGK
jgi:outer membrane protein assembly factor BamB